jgi:hypothetical protein
MAEMLVLILHMCCFEAPEILVALVALPGEKKTGSSFNLPVVDKQDLVLCFLVFYSRDGRHITILNQCQRDVVPEKGP